LTGLNDPYFFDAARALAKRLVSEGGATLADRINYGYRLTVARPATASELTKVTEFYSRELAAYQENKEAAWKTLNVKAGELANPAELAALTMVSNVLLNMDEAVTKE
jgi:hypothetical protein